ncbi:hypothetical protein [Niveibacterium sp. SC-1]|uniref:hypothetical protein n=1 Tax=Niveibacterium sp. SC-1 TaxID=3135646 RepID=UPI00311EC5FD
MSPSALHRIPLLVLLLLSTAAIADEAGDKAKDQADLAQADSLRAQAARGREAIAAERPGREAECARRFLVNRCLDQVREEMIQREEAALKQEVEAGRLERGVQARGVAAREAQRKAEEPQRDAERAAAAEEHHTEETHRQGQIQTHRKEVEQRQRTTPSATAIDRADQARREAARTAERQRQAEDAAKRAEQARKDYEHYEEKKRQRDEKAAKAAQPAQAPAASAAH